MKISQYIPSFLPGRFFYALAFAVAASISCSSGPPQEQVASERQANIEAIVKSYEQSARGHPAYNLYKSSCAACHGEYAAGIGKGTDAGGDMPVLMRETMPPYKFLSIEGTNDITPYYEWDIIDVVRNGNHT